MLPDDGANAAAADADADAAAAAATPDVPYSCAEGRAGLFNVLNDRLLREASVRGAAHFLPWRLWRRAPSPYLSTHHSDMK